jgi:myosin heavy subunit
VFDVNTNFFEERGGYEHAKKFYEAAYQLAVKEAGGEQYILSAVLHADERNKALSEQSGRDVFHYHLHVVYVPVVQKEILWTKRCKDPALVGTVKEVITQVSHSKKWPGRVTAERGFVNSYSLLQDRVFEHMCSAGFDGFERGERGSTAEHLDVLDYKIQRDNKRLDTLDQKIEKKQERVERLDEKITVREKAKATIAEVDAMGKSALLGGVNFTDTEVKKLKTLAKKSVTIENRNAEWKKKIAAVEQQLADVKQELNAVARDRDYWRNKFKDLEKMVKPYITAIINFPQELSAFISRHWQERQKSLTQEVSR